MVHIFTNGFSGLSRNAPLVSSLNVEKVIIPNIYFLNYEYLSLFFLKRITTMFSSNGLRAGLTNSLVLHLIIVAFQKEIRLIVNQESKHI